MSQSLFYISKEGQQQGPHPLDEVLRQVQCHELSPMDYIFDESIGDWVPLLQFSPLQSKLAELKPKAPPSSKSEVKELADPAPVGQEDPPPLAPRTEKPQHMHVEWYVLKGESKFGPFAFTDVVRMLQEKVVFEFDFVWHQGFETWRRVAEIEAFKPEAIRKLQTTLMPEVSEVFFRRRHRRTQHGGTLLVHDNQKVWRGQSIEISPGGAGLVMENATLTPGQILHLHFKPCDQVPAFNATCEIVSKKFVNEISDRSSPIRYGVKFTNLHPSAQKLLQEVSKKPDAA